MEIKRRLNKIAARLTPQIEAMNVQYEMKQMLDRFEELLTYSERKQAKIEANRGQPTDSQRRQARRNEQRQEIADAQQEDQDAQREDQESRKAEERADRTQEAERQPPEEAPPAPSKKRSKKKGRRSKAKK